MKFVAFRLKLVSEHSGNHKIISHLHGFWELPQKSCCCPASEQIHWNNWMLHSTYWTSATVQRDQGKQEISPNMSLEACSMLQYKHGCIKLTGFVLTCLHHAVSFPFTLKAAFMEQFTQPEKKLGIFMCPESPAYSCLWLNSHISDSN